MYIERTRVAAFDKAADALEISVAATDKFYILDFVIVYLYSN